MVGPLSPVMRKREPDDSAGMSSLPNVRQWIGFMSRACCLGDRFDWRCGDSGRGQRSDSGSMSGRAARPIGPTASIVGRQTHGSRSPYP